MKKAFRIFPLFILFLSVSCIAQKTSKEIEEVVFNAHTRGSSENITVVNFSIYHKTQNDSKTHFINKEKREAMESIINKIDVSKIANLKAPSNKRMFDGALHASISIKIGGKTYVSSSFDDNNPPAELKPLVALLREFLE